MFDRVFAAREYSPGVAFGAGGCSLTATRVPHYLVDAYALRVVADGRTLAYSGDSGPRPEPSSPWRRARTSSSARRPCSRATPTAGRAVTSRSPRLAPRSRPPAPGSSLITHRPAELDTPDGLVFAHDGLVLGV